MRKLTAHFRRDAALLGFALAYGLTALFVWAFAPGIGVVDLHDIRARTIALAFAPFLAGPGLLLLLAQACRPFWGKVRPRAGSSCDLCGTRGPTCEVRALRIAGFLVLFVTTQLSVRACRGCAVQACLKSAIHCLGLGWWSIISVFVTPGFVLHNLLAVPRILITTRPRGYAQAMLAEETEYAQRLLATKDFETVVGVLASRTRLQESEVRRFLSAHARR